MSRNIIYLEKLLIVVVALRGRDLRLQRRLQLLEESRP